MNEKNTNEKKMICMKCNIPLEPEEITLNYLNHQMKHVFLKCPTCGQVFIPEDVVNGKMKEVETLLEDK